MAEVLPFQGITYNPQKIKDLGDVATPPYDVISPDEQRGFHERHPKNMVRLILGEHFPSDTAADNCHTRAAGFFAQWLAEGTLLEDPQASMYCNTVAFSWQNRHFTRQELICRVRLRPFADGVVLPHERTFSKVRTERLELMKATQVNFSPIFSLYSDVSGEIGRLASNVQNRRPDREFSDIYGMRHSLWRFSDPALLEAISAAMAPKKLFIADGHHRYETALEYRDWLAQQRGRFSSQHPANYVVMALSSMEDPGLIILPAHRLLKAVDPDAMTTFIAKCEPCFAIRCFPFGGSDYRGALAALMDALRAQPDVNAIGVLLRQMEAFYLLTPHPGVVQRLFGSEIVEALRGLDVTVLTHLIFMKILGFDQARLDDEKRIAYASREAEAAHAVVTGDAEMAFFLNPTRIDQVRTVAQQGLIMPRKSTYFYPKVIAGQVMYRLTA